MIYQIDRIVSDVRVCRDENRTSGALITSGDIETLTLNEVIRSKIVEAVERVHSTAPSHMLQLGHNFEDDYDGDGTPDDYGIHWSNMESGWLLLPPDFMRLIVFEMSDWERPVYTPITPDDPLYARQRSRFKGIRGTSQDPVCAVVMRPEGKTLEFYSCKSQSATVSKGVYVPYPVIVIVDGVESIEISEPCYTAVVYEAAGLSSVAQNEMERAATLFEMAKQYLTR